MLRAILNAFIVSLLGLVLGAAASVSYLLPRLPSIQSLKDVHLQVPLKVYTRNRSSIGEFGETRRAPVKLRDLPPALIKAVLAAGDDRYYRHPGVDWRGILRAALQLAVTGEKSQGGSTITMQVARNFFLTREKTYLRKISEILLALKIERELNKDEILELYLNKIYLGHRAYGVAAAAHVYYGVEVQSLGLPEIAMIAGLPKAPSKLNPITNPARATERRNYILRRMLDLGMIGKKEYRVAARAKDMASLHGQRIEVSAPHVAEMVRAYMVKRFGEQAYTEGYRVFTTIDDRLQTAGQRSLREGLLSYDERHGYRGPEAHHALTEDASESEWERLLGGYSTVGDLRAALVIAVQDRSVTAYTPDLGLVKIDRDGLSWARPYIDDSRRGPAPTKNTRILKSGDVVRLRLMSHGGFRLAQLPRVEGALVALDPNDGGILALCGGFDFSRSKFNRAVQARRQPGSGFKPFIYSAALEAGYTAASVVNDAPIVFYEPGLDSVWRPENYTRTYRGPIRLREALALSRNLVSIRLLQSIGVNKAIRHIGRFGFDTREMPHNLSLALGTGGVTPLELAEAYAVLANGGFRVRPWFIQRIETDDGVVLMEEDPERVCAECAARDEQGSGNPDAGAPDRRVVRAIDPQNAWIMNSLLQEVIRTGTGTAARVLGRGDLAGKTGTTDEHKDTWFAGFNGRIVATTWVGFDQATSLGPKETGARVALPIWVDFMRDALAGMPESTMPEPPGLVQVRIDRETGLLTDATNPAAMFEVFRVDSVPQQLSVEPGIAGGASDTSAIPEQLF
jgi:penicillin-binding protein 1A